MAENTTDRRVRKTRSVLKSALIKLMREKPVNKISVRELTEVCDINRATFYLHYKDVFDMLEQLEQEFFVDIENIIDAHNPTDDVSFIKMLTDVFVYIGSDENKDFAQIIVGKYANSAFIVRFADLFKQKYYFNWDDVPAQAKEKSALVYSFVMSGAIGLIRSWIETPKPCRPEQAAELTGMLCLKGMMMLKR